MVEYMREKFELSYRLVCLSALPDINLRAMIEIHFGIFLIDKWNAVRRIELACLQHIPKFRSPSVDVVVVVVVVFFRLKTRNKFYTTVTWTEITIIIEFHFDMAWIQEGEGKGERERKKRRAHTVIKYQVEKNIKLLLYCVDL